MIQAYPDTLSVAQGETLILHIASDHPEFRVVLYRQGDTLALHHDFGWQDTRTVEFTEGTADAAWGWDGYEFPISDQWPSGAYIAMLWERDGDGEIEPDKGTTTTEGHFGKALFVVRSALPGLAAPILYRVPIATYHAYNVSGGASLYSASPGRVTMHRPGGGTGGHVTDSTVPGLGDVDELDQDSSRQTFEHYDAKFISWLEGAGYQVEYCADTDVSLDSQLDLLSRYALVLSIGHDEYWSPETRQNLRAYIAQGGNLACFSGNTCWWRITYDADMTGFRCNRDGTVTQVDSDQWWVIPKHDPSFTNEDTLTGVSYRNGGGWWWPGRPQIGFTVEHAGHWAFEGGVDAQFGEPESLVGYECDGAELTAASIEPGHPAEPTFQDGTPSGFELLAVGMLTGVWSFENRDPDSPTAAVAPRAATMGIYTASGTVFTAGVVDWARVLVGDEPNVVQITHNVLRRLGGAPRTRTAMLPTAGLVALDAYSSADDAPGRLGHVMVATAGGAVQQETVPDTATGGAPVPAVHLGQFAGAHDIAAYISGDDQRHHAIVAQADGTLTDLELGPGPTTTSTDLGTYHGLVAVSAFYSADDQYRHAIVAQDDGTVSEVYFHPVDGREAVALGVFPGVVDVGSFYSDDDDFRHTIVAQADGTVSEIFFHPEQGLGVVELAQVPGAGRLAAHCAPDDVHFDRRVVVSSTDGRVHELRFAAHTPIVRSVIANVDVVVDVASFSTPSDGGHHTVLGLPDDSVDVLSSTA